MKPLKEHIIEDRNVHDAIFDSSSTTGKEEISAIGFHAYNDRSMTARFLYSVNTLPFKDTAFYACTWEVRRKLQRWAEASRIVNYAIAFPCEMGISITIRPEVEGRKVSSAARNNAPRLLYSNCVGILDVFMQWSLFARGGQRTPEVCDSGYYQKLPVMKPITLILRRNSAQIGTIEYTHDHNPGAHQPSANEYQRPSAHQPGANEYHGPSAHRPGTSGNAPDDDDDPIFLPNEPESSLPLMDVNVPLGLSTVMENDDPRWASLQDTASGPRRPDSPYSEQGSNQVPSHGGSDQSGLDSLYQMADGFLKPSC